MVLSLKTSKLYKTDVCIEMGTVENPNFYLYLCTAPNILRILPELYLKKYASEIATCATKYPRTNDKPIFLSHIGIVSNVVAQYARIITVIVRLGIMTMVAVHNKAYTH